jgi:hypothetical protein
LNQELHSGENEWINETKREGEKPNERIIYISYDRVFVGLHYVL